MTETGARAAPAPSRARSIGVPAWAPVAGVTALAAVLAFALIGDKSVWLDEAFSIGVAQSTWAELWDVVTTRQANMSPFYVLLKLWSPVGDSEAAVRALPAVLAVASVPLVYVLARRAFGTVVAVVAAVLLVVNAFFVQYAQEVRGYSMVLLLVTAATYLLVVAVEAGGPRSWTAYALVAALSVYVHFFAAFVLLAHLVALPFAPRVRWRRAIGAFAGIAVLVAPLALFVATRDVGQIDWIPEPTVKVVYAALEDVTGGGGPLPFAAYAVAAAAGAVVAARALRDRVARWRHVLVVAWAALPVALSLALSLAGKPMFVSKYLIVALPGIVILAALGIAALRRPAFVAGAAALLVALSGLGLYDWYGRYEKDDWRGASAFVMQRVERGDGIVFYNARERRGFEYYVVARDDEERAPKPIYPRQRWGELEAEQPKPGKLDFRWLARQVGARRRVWLVLSHEGRTRNSRRTAARIAATIEDEGLRALDDAHFTRIDVRLYEQRLHPEIEE
ncbi:MAG TPA: glycosyltransferase family 39 protein [Actinomycetota bacterium]|nr:glycosyltransferase family 39 protein [Actinomycetota bacterium]